MARDLPAACVGCFGCIAKGEDVCPHADAVRPIRDSLEAADLIVLASPVYALDVAASMKNLLDHLCFQWMSHRPNAAMFSKVGLSVVTTAGAGAGHALGTLGNSLTFWGIGRVFKLGAPVAAMSWQEVSQKRKAALEKKTRRIADHMLRAHAGTKPSFKVRFLFGLMGGMQKKNNWNQVDRAHWERRGWLAGKKPF